MVNGDRIKFLRKRCKLTQGEVAEKIGTIKQTIYKYEMGLITNIPSDKIEAMARLFDVSPSYLMGWEDGEDGEDYDLENIKIIDSILPITVKKFPLLGEIACGEPILANEDRESYILSGTDIDADFCLKAKDDSMIGARIHDGDIVFIKKADVVNNGEVAAVIIDGVVLLKRFYYFKDENLLTLQSENPKYPPKNYVNEQLDHIRVIGKAIAFQSDVR